MKWARRNLALLALLVPTFSASGSPAQELGIAADPSSTSTVMPTVTPPPRHLCDGICVPEEDMRAFVQLLEERKCLQETLPAFELDPITVVTDRDGRVYYSGDEPLPYKLRMAWCHYEAEAVGKLKVVAAVQEPPYWGFRLRPKAYLGALPLEAFQEGADLKDTLDGGLMLDVLYFHELNLNVTAGIRSVGAGVGVDIFKSFGAFAGYAYSFKGRHNPSVSLWFSFW